MARLPDEQWAMIEDSIDKKRTAASAFKQRTHCGKGGSVKFPSDYMSKKELNAMNGEVKSYRLNSAMSWDEFKSMPDDLKVAYINSIRERFCVPDKYVAEMFGIPLGQLGLYLRDLKLELVRDIDIWNKEAFLAWRSGADTSLVEENEPVEDNAKDPENIKKYTWYPMTWEDFKMLSDENKIDYVRWIRENFKAPDKAIGTMLGCSQHTMSVCLRKLNFSSPSSNGKVKWDKEGFAKWQNSKAIEAIEEEPAEVDILETVVEDLKTGVPEVVDIPEEMVEVEKVEKVEKTEKTEAKVLAIPTVGELNFDCPADQALNTLAMLLGNKHIRLSVRWDVVVD